MQYKCKVCFITQRNMSHCGVNNLIIYWLSVLLLNVVHLINKHLWRQDEEREVNENVIEVPLPRALCAECPEGGDKILKTQCISKHYRKRKFKKWNEMAEKGRKDGEAPGDEIGISLFNANANFSQGGNIWKCHS